jgi:hypothetical protein
VSRDNFLLMTPLLFEVLSGALDLRDCSFPIRALLGTTRFVEATVQGIDLDRRVVRLIDDNYSSPLTTIKNPHRPTSKILRRWGLGKRSEPERREPERSDGDRRGGERSFPSPQRRPHAIPFAEPVALGPCQLPGCYSGPGSTFFAGLSGPGPCLAFRAASAR